MKYILKHIIDGILISLGVMLVQMAIGSEFTTAILFIGAGVFLIRLGCYLLK